MLLLSLPVVCAPRRLCAPSFVLMAGLALGLLASPAQAQAPGGSYSVTYTGGTIQNGTTPTPPYFNKSAYLPGASLVYAWGGYSAASPGSTATCSGAITASLTWSSTTILPPPAVIIEEDADASWSGTTGTTGQVTNPLGGAATTNTPGPGQNWTATRYTGKSSPGATIPVPACTGLLASVTGPPPNNQQGVQNTAQASYQVSATPVTLSLTGPILDSSGNYNILVGQKCTATVNGIPSGNGWKAVYAWNVSGTTFQSWSPTTPPIGTTPANSQASYFDGSPPPATNPTSWYWNDPSNNPETVKCTVKVTPPAGQGSALTLNVAAPTPISVQVPKWTAYGVGGYMQVNTSAPNQKGAICFYAGPTAGQKGGMNFTATSTTPPLFGPGTVELVQIITPIEDYMTNAVPSVKVPDPEDSKIGLDTHYPKTGPVYVEGGQPYQTNDSPAFGLANDVKSIVMQHSVTDYLMYEPPGSTQFVPLATFSWSTNGSATIPPSNNWADYATTHGSDSAGTVTPSSQTNFQVGNTFPSWTRVNVFPGF